MKGKGLVAAGALAAAGVAALFIAPWEGRELAPYQDIVDVWTVCYGSTTAPMREYTDAECQAILKGDVATHLSGVAKCIARPLDENEWVAVGSWTFNVGVRAACGSTLVRQINAGQPAEVWCRQLLRWNRAGGREVRGLTNRRQAEFKVCTQ